MNNHSLIVTVVQALRRAERILVITGADLSADFGMPTYRGLGGLYNGRTEEGLLIKTALSRPMLRHDPVLCWEYLAELDKACLAARSSAGHEAIAELQKHKPECWVLIQNIDGLHRRAGLPAEWLTKIHGELAPLYRRSCGTESDDLEGHLHGQLPPRCAACGEVLRPSMVLLEKILPEEAIGIPYHKLCKGFDVVLVVGTTASFPYAVKPMLHAQQAGGFAAEVNPDATDLSERIDVKMTGRILDIMPRAASHVYR